MPTLNKTSRLSTDIAQQIAFKAPLLAFAAFLAFYGFLVLAGVLVGMPLTHVLHDSTGLLIGLSQTVAIFAILGLFFSAIAGFFCWCLSIANLRRLVNALLSLALRLAKRVASFWKAEPTDTAATPCPPPRGLPLVASANRVMLLTPSALTGAAPLLE